MNFPAWSGQSSVQPMFVEKSALSIFPDEPSAAQICGADFSPYWHGCRCPLVWTNSPFRQALDHKSSRLKVSTCCRFCRLCRFRWLCRFQANAAEADIAAESADTVPRAATAPVSKPAVFLVEPWTVQPVQTHRQHLVPILPTLPIPTLPPVPEPALFRQRVPSTTFPAWPEQSGVQPMFVKQSTLPIFPDGPPAALNCAADLSRPWHSCHRPNIQTSSLFRQALDCPVPRSQDRVAASVTPCP
jgi:hypothetical protein